MQEQQIQPKTPIEEALAKDFNDLLIIFQGIANKELSGKSTSCVPQTEEVH